MNCNWTNLQIIIGLLIVLVILGLLYYLKNNYSFFEKYNFSKNSENKYNKDICVVFVCNKPYFEKFIQTCNDLVSKGKYKGNICLVIGDDLKDDPLLSNKIIQKYTIQIQYFPEIRFPEEFIEVQKKLVKSRYDKKFQYHKTYLFHPFFKKWKYIFYMDCGMHIYSDIQPILEQCTPHTLFAHSDAYPTFEWKLHTQFDTTQENMFKKLNKDYNLDIDYFQTGILLYSTDIIEKDTFNNLYQLMLKYPICHTNEQGIMALYFTNIKPVWKPMPVQNNSTYFYDYSNRYKDKPYIMVKYPDAFS